MWSGRHSGLRGGRGDGGRGPIGRRSVGVETGVECGRLLRGSSDRSFVGVVESRRIGVVGWVDILEILAAGAGGSSNEGMSI